MNVVLGCGTGQVDNERIIKQALGSQTPVRCRGEHAARHRDSRHSLCSSCGGGNNSLVFKCLCRQKYDFSRGEGQRQRGGVRARTCAEKKDH